MANASSFWSFGALHWHRIRVLKLKHGEPPREEPDTRKATGILHNLASSCLSFFHLYTILYIKQSYLVRGTLALRVRLRVLGLWNTTLYLGFNAFFHWLFFTALAALRALSVFPEITYHALDGFIDLESCREWEWLDAAAQAADSCSTVSRPNVFFNGMFILVWVPLIYWIDTWSKSDHVEEVHSGRTPFRILHVPTSY